MQVQLQGNDAKRAFDIVANIGEGAVSLLKASVMLIEKMASLVDARVVEVRASAEEHNARALLLQAEERRLQMGGRLEAPKPQKRVEDRHEKPAKGVFNPIRGAEQFVITEGLAAGEQAQS